MSPPKAMQYQAYSLATRTVAKTRQVVMLYDGTIRFLKQAQQAIREKRIEDRFNLLKRASDVINGLQGSIDFENGGEIAHTLLKFYTQISMRILSVNFHPQEGHALCEGIIDDLKQMRDVWDSIDQSTTAAVSGNPMATAPVNISGASSVTFSA
jgi:flagellar protein FliS